MSESSSEREIFGGQWAGRLCVVMLVGLGIVTSVAYYNEHQVPNLESTEESTAVGDKAFFPMPPEENPSKLPAGTVTFNGKPLNAVGVKTYDERDSKMVRIAMDDTKRYAIYSSTEPVKKVKGEPADTGGKVYFLKVGPGKFVKMKEG